MLKFKTSVAVLAFAFLTASPLVAAEISIPGAQAPKIPAAPQTPAVEKPDLAGTLKQKASDAVDKAKTSVDKKAEQLQESLGVKKDAAKGEVLDVTKETVTVETPSGISQETAITVTPETPAAAPVTPSIPVPAGK